MAIVVTQEGALVIWKQILTIANLGNPVVHLFSGNYSPQHSDKYATYSAIECNAMGYAAIQLNNPAVNWSFSAIGAGQQAAYVTLTWTLLSATTLYGYWLADATNSFSMWAEAFPSPYVYGATGGQFNLVLQPWLASQPSVSGIPCP